jgi:hypothetical protein
MLHEMLANPPERPVLARPRLEFAISVKPASAGSWEKPKCRVERFTELVQRGETIPEVVRIIYFETPTGPIALRDVTSAQGAPGPNQKILVAEEL